MSPRVHRRPRSPLGARRLPLLALGVVTAGLVATPAGARTAAAMDNAVARGNAPNRLTSGRRPAAGGRIRDITLQVDPGRRGLGAYSDTWGDNLVFDKNHDGIPDVLISNHIQPWQIWLGHADGSFTFDQALRGGDRHNCAAADFGGLHGTPPDGRMDLYCVRGANRGTADHKRNWLLIQRPDGGFANAIASWGAADPSGRGRTVSILNIRGNRRPSLFVGNRAGISYPSRDHIYVNVGGHFVQRRTGGLPSTQNTWCSDTGDFNHDGRQDFLTCSYSLRLYKNLTTRGHRVRYRNVARAEGIPQGPRCAGPDCGKRHSDAELVDLNHDGWPDLVMLSKHGLTVRLNRHRTPHFSKVNFRFSLVAGESFCVGRANADTAPDLLVVQGLKSMTDKVQRRDWMLINSGSGTRFRALPVPQPPLRNGRNGNGDTCTAIPGYRGTRAAWTINNGWGDGQPGRHRGYRQLVIYKP